MSNEPNSPASSSAKPAQPEASSDAILPWGERWDAIAQERFNRTDWIELAAAILLSLATIAAAWAAYQSTRICSAGPDRRNGLDHLPGALSGR